MLSDGSILSLSASVEVKPIKTFNPPHHQQDSTAHLSQLPECQRGVGGRRDHGIPVNQGE